MLAEVRDARDQGDAAAAARGEAIAKLRAKGTWRRSPAWALDVRAGTHCARPRGLGGAADSRAGPPGARRGSGACGRRQRRCRDGIGDDALVVDDVIGANRSDQIHLRCAADAGDVGAKRPRDLHPERPHAARRPKDQHLLPLLHLPLSRKPWRAVTPAIGTVRRWLLEHEVRRLGRDLVRSGTRFLGEDPSQVPNTSSPTRACVTFAPIDSTRPRSPGPYAELRRTEPVDRADRVGKARHDVPIADEGDAASTRTVTSPSPAIGSSTS